MRVCAPITPTLLLLLHKHINTHVWHPHKKNSHTRIIQLYEMVVVRRSLMIVGLSFSGKTPLNTPHA